MADLVRIAGQSFLEHSRQWMTWQHRKVLLAIATCARRVGHLLSSTRLLLRKRLRQFRADALGVGVEVEDVVAHFAARSGLLVAAEGHGGIEDVVAIDPDGSGAEAGTNRIGRQFRSVPNFPSGRQCWRSASVTPEIFYFKLL